jgi:YD repeat-containing protein
VVDLSLSVPGIPLAFVRVYNSQSPGSGPLGYGWTHSYNLSITDRGDELLVWDRDGRALSFERRQDGPLTGRYGVKDRLEEDPQGGVCLTKKRTQWRYVFDPEGKLLRIEDLHAKGLDLIYEQDQLREVRSDFGKSLWFDYRDGRIERITDPRGNTILYGYDQANLASVRYPDGTSTHYRYEDPNDPHNMTAQLDTANNLVGQWVYDAQDRTVLSEGAQGADRMEIAYGFLKTRVRDSLGRTKTVHTQIQEYIYLVERIEGQGCATCGANQRFRYDHNLNLVEAVDGEGIATRYAWIDPQTHRIYGYDSQNNPTIRIEAFGTPLERKTFYTYTYDLELPLLVREKTETRESVLVPGETRTTRWGYDEAGCLTSKEETGYVWVDGAPTRRTATTRYGYTDLGELSWIDGPRDDVSDITVFEYYPNIPEQGDNRGELRAMVNPLGHRTECSDYDPNGNVGQITDPNGLVTVYTYDPRNRIETVTEADFPPTRYGYDHHGNLRRVALPNGITMEYRHDPADRLTEIQDRLGNRIVYTLDTEGNRIQEDVFDPLGILRKTLSMDYDPQNRLEWVRPPGGALFHYGYDRNGNLETFIDAKGRLTQYQHDALNRLWEVTQHTRDGEIVTGYGYDSHDHLTTIRDPNGLTTTYRFDDFGGLCWVICPDTGKTRYSYDEAGNMIAKTDARGGMVTYCYDSLNRLTMVDYPEDPDIIYTYDQGQNGTGRLTGIRDPSGTSLYRYDPLGTLIRVEKTVQGVTYTSEYQYDTGTDRLVGLTYPSGTRVTYDLDDTGRIERVSATQDEVTRTLAETISYRPFGPLMGLTYGNGSVLFRDYDLRYKITRLQAAGGLELGYGYGWYDGETRIDLEGIQTITDHLDPAKTQSFGYDDLDRLESATGIYGTIGYSYDFVGNRLTRTMGGKIDTYTYIPGTNRLGAITGAAPMSFGYDETGNTTHMGERGFRYGENNRLEEALEGGSVLGEYVYNAWGQRVVKKSIQGIRVFHYDLWGRLIAETDGQGEPVQEYLYLNGEPLALLDGSTRSKASYRPGEVCIEVLFRPIVRRGFNRFGYLCRRSSMVSKWK